MIVLAVMILIMQMIIVIAILVRMFTYIHTYPSNNMTIFMYKQMNKQYIYTQLYTFTIIDRLDRAVRLASGARSTVFSVRPLDGRIIQETNKYYSQ